MKTSTENLTEAVKPKRALVRKRVPSMLDPFTEQLLQMDAETKPLHEMMAWLKIQKI